MRSWNEGRLLEQNLELLIRYENEQMVQSLEGLFRKGKKKKGGGGMNVHPVVVETIHL